jgi:hypothetical protein
MDGEQLGILEEADKVRLAGFLQRKDRVCLNAQGGVEMLDNLPAGKSYKGVNGGPPQGTEPSTDQA